MCSLRMDGTNSFPPILHALTHDKLKEQPYKLNNIHLRSGNGMKIHTQKVCLNFNAKLWIYNFVLRETKFSPPKIN